MQPEPIEQIRSKHRDEWIAIQVTKTNRKGDPVSGVVLGHGKVKDDVINIVRQNRGFIVFTYTGEVPIGVDGVILHGNRPV